jgi:glycosyltransferase involved in cell wall biosynthesis
VVDRSHVGIVYPRANLDSTPLASAAELLARHGYSVDLFTLTAAGQAPPQFDNQRIRFYSLGVEGLADVTTSGLRAAFRRLGWLHRIARAPLGRAYAAMADGVARGSRFLRKPQPLHEHCRCLIGVDPDGLVLAYELANSTPVAYYSFELLLSDEVRTPAEQRLKLQERRLSRQSPFVVVQDADRGRLLAEDNQLQWERLVMVPNAPLGPARRIRGTIWHTRFGLPADRRILIHAGSLGKWTGIESILESVPTWPEPWVLVVHTRYDAESSPYVDALRRRADPNRVFFSLKPVPRQGFDELIDSADVGLAFYIRTGDSWLTQRNIQTIGLSSGKLGAYLRAGLPVIVNASTSVASTVEFNGCGIAAESAEHVGTALARIQADYDRYSQRACVFFDAHLDFGRTFRAVIDRIDRLDAPA